MAVQVPEELLMLANSPFFGRILAVSNEVDTFQSIIHLLVGISDFQWVESASQSAG
jgi:hypothetical protein